MASYSNANTQQVDLDENGNCRWAGVHAGQRSSVSDLKLYGSLNLNEIFFYNANPPDGGGLNANSASAIVPLNYVPCDSVRAIGGALSWEPVIPTAAGAWTEECKTTGLTFNVDGSVENLTGGDKNLYYYFVVEFYLETDDNRPPRTVNVGISADGGDPSPGITATNDSVSYLGKNVYTLRKSGSLLVTTGATLSLYAENVSTAPTATDPFVSKVVFKSAQLTLKVPPP